MATTELEIRNLTHFYDGQKILNIPYLPVQAKECLVIFGPNGAGKSTLLRIASLLEKPSQGEIYHRGVLVPLPAPLSLRRRLVHLLDRPLFFRGPVRDNLLYGLKIRGIGHKEQQKRLAEISAQFKLEPYLERQPDELSAGEKQRVNLARAFILQPDILFLDEPLANLDVCTREEILVEFKQIRKEKGQTALLVTHNREEAAYLADRMAVLVNGEIVQSGKPEEVFASPATVEVAHLMGQETLVEGTVVGQEKGLLKVALANHFLYTLGTCSQGEKVTVIFRPEEVILAPEKPESSVRNWFHGLITEIKALDKLVLVSLDCGFKLKAYLSRPALEELKVSVGRKFWAGVKATSLSIKPFKDGHAK
jgi:molybdate transport system ATP-binding protein